RGNQRPASCWLKSVGVRPPGATKPARMRRAGAGGRGLRAGTAARSKYGKLLREFGRAAVRALGSLPVRRANQDFAVLVALLAVKFVNRHRSRIIRAWKKLKRGGWRKSWRGAG